MRLLKMKIRRTKEGNVTRYTYPTPHYDAFKVIFGPVYEGGTNEYAQVARDRNLDDEYIILGVEDKDAAQFLEAHGKKHTSGFEWSCEEVTREEMETLGTQWIKQADKISDPIKVVAILAKVANYEELNLDDAKAIDPKDPALGITKTKSFAEILNAEINQRGLTAKVV